MSLIDYVKGFYQSLGSSVQEKDSTMLIAERPVNVEEMERTCVWLLTQNERKGRDRILVEEDYLGRFKGMLKKWPGAKLYLLVDTTEDLTSDFRVKASSEYRVRIQVPSQLFDMPFSWEVAKAAASATKELSNNAKQYDLKRVPQAYVNKSNDIEGQDIVTDLVDELDNFLENQDPFIWVIVAPAGQGKSVCFSSLFGKIYSKFQENKKRYMLFPRPLPLVSAHLKDAAGPNVLGLIDAFIRTEFAAHARREYFNWLVDNRFGILMLDGLDEVITRDSKFIEYLEDRVTAPYSKPAIIISMRDSLFETSEELSAFISDYSQYVNIYNIEPWDKKAKRVHAWINLEGRQSRKDEPDTPSVAQYLSLLERNETLNRLSSTPFYADLLIKTELDPKRENAIKEQDLISLAIENMCTREYEKGLLSKEIFPPKAFREWLEEIAAQSYQGGGISAQEFKDYAALAAVFASRELSDEEQRTLMDHITMAPFFKRSETSGRLEITHELLAEFLAGNHFTKFFRSNPAKFAYFLSQRPWPPDSILFSVLSRALEDKLEDLITFSNNEPLSQHGFRNLVQLINIIPMGFKKIKEGKIRLDGAKLQGVVFQNADLSGVSFRSADLSSAGFFCCNLQHALFEGAIIRKTIFEKIPERGLLSARFGDCEHFESAIVDGRLIEDYKKFRKWNTEKTGIKEQAEGLCPSARQLLFLFKKFIHVDGQGRRDILDRRGVLRGKKEPGAETIENFLRASLDFGYFEEERGQRIRRASGTKYGEMVTFVKNQITSPDIRSLLDSLCRVPLCTHVPMRQ